MNGGHGPQPPPPIVTPLDGGGNNMWPKATNILGEVYYYTYNIYISQHLAGAGLGPLKSATNNNNNKTTKKQQYYIFLNRKEKAQKLLQYILFSERSLL